MDSVDIKKIAIVGPECTGKSDLSQFLAKHYQTAFVPEYARGYIDNLVNPYEESDLLKIAHGQLRLEDQWLNDANKLLICDTTLLVIKVWSEVKYDRVDPYIADEVKARHYDLHLLTYIDIPWQDDPQREHPGRRDELYNIYVRELRELSIPYVDIRGSREQRESTAIEAIDKLLG